MTYNLSSENPVSKFAFRTQPAALHRDGTLSVKSALDSKAVAACAGAVVRNVHVDPCALTHE